MFLIGLTGRGLNEKEEFVSTARVGKDFVGQILNDHFDVMRISFALPIKRVAQLLFGLYHDEAWNDDKAFKETPMSDYGISPRRIQQILGTEVGRTLLDSNIWINIVERVCDAIENNTYYNNPLLASQEIMSSQHQSFDEIMYKAISIIFYLPEEHVRTAHINNQPLPLDGLFKCTDVQEIIDAFKTGIVFLMREAANDSSLNEETAFQTFWNIRQERPFYNAIFEGPYSSEAKDIVVVMDVRFDNEAEYCRNKGKLAHISRVLHGMIRVGGHVSEKGINPEIGDILIDNNRDKEHIIQQFNYVVNSLQSNLTK